MTTPLEQTMPVYDFREPHSRRIEASPEQVWQVLITLTFVITLNLDQLTLTRPLVAIRLGAHTATPAKHLFTEGPVQMFEIAPPIHAAGGAVARLWQRSGPPNVRRLLHRRRHPCR